MTEEEAKTRWCPFVRVALGWTETVQSYDATEQAVAATVNRGERISGPTNCVGSQCMAWRWDKQPVKAGDELYERTYRGMVSDTYTITIAESDVPGDGHCGLAGNPTRG